MDSRHAVVKLLVTGATGFVASHLVPTLAKSHEVIALGHDATRIPVAAGVESLEVDLRERGFSTRLPQVDAIVHLAQANVPFPDGAADLFAVNTAATVELLEHARRHGASHFIYASSASVYGVSEHPFSEDDRPTAQDFYSATKTSAELLAHPYESHLSVTTLRLVAPYGPGQRNRMIPRLIASVLERRPVALNLAGRPRMNPIFVTDVEAVVVAALGSSTSQVINAAGDDTASIREIAELIGQAAGIEPVFEEGTTRVAGDIVCENARMKELLGQHELVSLAAGLQQTVHATTESD